MGLLFAGPAEAASRPHYDVPSGFTRCSQATAWHGFFKWASVRQRSCRTADRFMTEYAKHAKGATMPKHVAGYSCRIYYWRNADGDIYASRHTCTRHGAKIRFYGMV